MRLGLDSKYQALLSPERRHPCRRPAASASRTLSGEGIPQVEIVAGRGDARGVHNRADQTQWRQPDLGEGGGWGGEEERIAARGPGPSPAENMGVCAHGEICGSKGAKSVR